MTRTQGITDPKEIERIRKETDKRTLSQIATMKDSSTQAFLEFKLVTNSRLDALEKAILTPDKKEEVKSEKPKVMPNIGSVSRGKPKSTDWEISKD